MMYPYENEYLDEHQRTFHVVTIRRAIARAKANMHPEPEHHLSPEGFPSLAPSDHRMVMLELEALEDRLDKLDLEDEITLTDWEYSVLAVDLPVKQWTRAALDHIVEEHLDHFETNLTKRLKDLHTDRKAASWSWWTWAISWATIGAIVWSQVIDS